MKTLIQMIEDACTHHNINMTIEETNFLVSRVPCEIPWNEDGAEFITAMVLGWDASYAYKKPRKEISEYKYTLWLTMYTDDDAEINYNGNSYCYYSDKLKISKGFDTIQEAVSFLTNKINIVEGYKATDTCKYFLKDCCDLMEEGDFPIYNTYTGNQEFDFSLDVKS